MAHQKHSVFVTGGTGFMGRRLIVSLLERGHDLKAMVREGSQHRLPEGAQAVVGDPLSPVSISRQVIPADTFVQLVGIDAPKSFEGRRVSFDRPNGRMLRSRGRRMPRRPAFCLRERGAARAGHEGLYRCTVRGRRAHSAAGLECNHPAPVVRARTRPPVADAT